MAAFTIVNSDDPHYTFEVDAKDVNEAAFAALEMLGWFVSEPEEEDGDENKCSV